MLNRSFCGQSIRFQRNSQRTPKHTEAPKMPTAALQTETASAPSIALPSSSSVKIETYNRAAHFASIEEICKNVYGGTDYLPRMIDKWQSEGDMVLVASISDSAADSSSADKPSTSSSSNDQAHAVACARQHGNAFWVYGLRTHESVRGRGLARQLLSTLCLRLKMDFVPSSSSSADTDPIFLSATIGANGPMRAIFAREGWDATHRLFVWPPWSVTYELDKVNHDSRTDSSVATLASHYAPASALLNSPSSSPLLIEKATSVEQLRSAASQILASAGPSGRVTDDERTLFLPFEYKAYPIDSAMVGRMVESGNAHVVSDPSTKEPLAVVASYLSEEMRQRTCVGVLAKNSDEALSRTLSEFALRQHARPVCFLYLPDRSFIPEEGARDPAWTVEKWNSERIGICDEFLLTAK